MQNTKFFIKLIQKWYRPKKMDLLYSILLVFILIFTVLVVVYLAGGTKYAYIHLMYIPLILAVFNFGYLGGIFFGSIAGYLTSFIPLEVSTMTMQTPENWMYRLLFFVIVSTINGFIIDIILKTMKDIEKLTFHNRITNIHNRKHFDTFFKDNKSLQNKYLTLFEIENFNQILNEYGNTILEGFIKKLSITFKKLIRGNATLFHFRDNTFGILMSNYNTDTFKKDIDILNQNITIDNILIYPELSVGIARFIDTSERLLQDAEIARAHAKKNLFSCFYFNKNINKLHHKKLSILNELPGAINNNEFSLYFHPKVDLKTGLIDCAEVLIRWIHPREGIISPDLFMPYMEETNLINLFTEWLIIATLKIQHEWRKDGFHLKLAINTPIACLKNKSIINTLKKSDSDLSSLKFEILERNLIEDFEEVYLIMKSLKKYGITFALDDFGTGFSAISYLRNLPFDELKIDQMFIKNMKNDPKDYNIVNSSITLGKSMGLTIVAEGVEDIETFKLLKELNCDYAQGYFSTKPLEREPFKKFCIQYNKSIK